MSKLEFFDLIVWNEFIEYVLVYGDYKGVLKKQVIVCYIYLVFVVIVIGK